MSKKDIEMRVPNTIANVPCCVCGKEDSESYFKRRYDKFNYNGEFSMRKCSGCGLLFCSPRLDNEGIAALYDANYYVFGKADQLSYSRAFETYRRTVKVIEDKVEDRTLLDVGCGKGYLLAALKGLNWDTYGIEISSDAMKYAESEFGLKGFAGTIEQYLEKQDRRTFPLVLCIDILEHVSDPKYFINCIGKVTSDNGYIILDTPNSGAYDIDVFGSEWRGFNPFHIYVFNENNIKTLLKSEGFEIEYIFTYNNVSLKKNEPSFIDTLKNLFSSKEKDPDIDSLETCIKACSQSRSYFDTQDAKTGLFKEMKGENLIVVAKKVR